ncbi:UNVERIFIED_CONTAM: holo-[acyl-carrier protein] synthase [Williamsia faeni]
MNQPDAVRIGCDVVSLADIDDSMDSFGDRFLHRVFTNREIQFCTVTGTVRRERLAARFAAKEAVVKALAIPDIATPPHEIEVINDATGRPHIVLHGSIAALARSQDWGPVQVSLSHTDCHSMAVVAVLITPTAS